jgi:hypothetical protein
MGAIPGILDKDTLASHNKTSSMKTSTKKRQEAREKAIFTSSAIFLTS